jgi:hypothetical protein
VSAELFGTILSRNEALQDNDTINSLSLLELPVHRTTPDYFVKIQSCVNAYGGCAHVQALQSDWANHLGSNVWRD